MKRSFAIILGAALACLVILPGAAETGAATADSAGSASLYDAKGGLLFPAEYRTWIFLSSGLDMSYSADSSAAGQHVFNNVFVQRAAYDSFLKTGVWPNGAVLLLENRGGATNQSILKHGQIQTGEVLGYEAHVKDARFKDGWAFFGFDDNLKPATEIPHTASCYSCHQAHAAADTTFVQFYPTLLPVATNLKTLSASYLAETAPKN
ncbi:MAG TPA: cytochrome P460 family protein [Rhizomicrobium sp.]|jgi:hypothetical protein